MSKSNAPEMLWRSVRIKAADECWEWTGPVNSSGYGGFSCGGVLTGSHVWAFKLRSGRWPKKKCVLHACDNRRCCNPAHLFEGSKSDNSVDCWAKGRNFYQRQPAARPKGSAHRNAKLTDAQIVKIRMAYATGGWTQKQLGALHGVSQRVICLVVNGRSYK